MNFHLYAGPGGWVLVPECILPPAECDVYGPFELVATVSESQLQEADRALVRAAIEQSLYALATDGVAELLKSQPRVPSESTN